MKHRRFWFWGVFSALLVAITVAGLEALSAFVVPPWPARDLRPIEVSNAAVASTLSGAQAVPTYNSWGLRDREHPPQKPAGISRTVLIGERTEGCRTLAQRGIKAANRLLHRGYRRGDAVIHASF